MPHTEATAASQLCASIFDGKGALPSRYFLLSHEKSVIDGFSSNSSKVRLWIVKYFAIVYPVVGGISSESTRFARSNQIFSSSIGSLLLLGGSIPCGVDTVV